MPIPAVHRGKSQYFTKSGVILYFKNDNSVPNHSNSSVTHFMLDVLPSKNERLANQEPQQEI